MMADSAIVITENNTLELTDASGKCKRGTVKVGNYFFRIPTERLRPLH